LAEVSFGEWLKRRRSALGLTQEQLALQIHCSTSALRKFESEERRPSAEVVESLAEIFTIPPEERPSFLRFARGDWQAFVGGDTENAPWHASKIEQQSNLPSPITSFIGREKEQVEVLQLLDKNRLVTLTGTGGIGKTRLAIQVGNRLVQGYPDGVWFIPLDSLFDPLLVPQTVASVLDIRESAERPVMETLRHALRGKTLLLILDNCEHLLNSCAQLTTILLTHCPNLRILTTSRELLNNEGEATYYLPSLSTPAESAAPETLAEYESIQLFVERAGLALSTFQLREETAQPIVDICRRVDGIPLAIELTAARVNFLNVEEISKQLHKSFALLESNHRTTLSRHQTLQASLDWSWSLLTDSEQVFLRQLSVFAGGWTLEAAESICDGNALNLTKALVQKSLIKVKHDLERETRYHFHEMVRQYAHEKLLEAGGVEALRDKHLAYFVKLVEQAEPELYRSNQIFWFNKLDEELDNLRMALEWALATDVQAGLRIASIPWRFWQRRDYREWGDWLGQLLDRYPKSDSLRAQALAVSSAYFFAQGNMAEARKVAEQALQLARALSDPQNEALSLLFLGRSIAFPGGYLEGTPLLEQSRDIYRAVGDKIGQAMATGWMGIDHNDLEHSNSLLLKSLKLHRELGNLTGIAYCLAFLGYHAILGMNFSSSGPWLEEARTLYHELGDVINEADALEGLGILADRQGDFQQAYTYFEQSITLYDKARGYWAYWPRVRMGHAFLREGNIAQAREIFEITIQEFQKDEVLLIGVIYTIEGLASLHVNQGDAERAARLIAWADARREELGNKRPPVEQEDVDKDIAACLARIGESAFSDLYEEGRKMTIDEAIVYALGED
jgi:predicted ATPase/DNA-binding XRE family transcriptional regulator